MTDMNFCGQNIYAYYNRIVTDSEQNGEKENKQLTQWLCTVCMA